MNMNASVRYKNQFGIDTIVPACPISEIFAEIAQTRTLTKPTIEKMKSLGYVFTVLQEQRTI